jgi:hypothetical protein
MLRGSRAVKGRADAGLFALLLMVFLDKSRRDGRGLELGIGGDPGSFLTMIFGGALAPRELLEWTLIQFNCGEPKGHGERTLKVSFGKPKGRWDSCCHFCVRSSGHTATSRWAQTWELAPVQKRFWVLGRACLQMQMLQPFHEVPVREPWRLRHS